LTKPSKAKKFRKYIKKKPKKVLIEFNLQNKKDQKAFALLERRFGKIHNLGSYTDVDRSLLLK
jgi:hypothetical protein